MDTCWAGRGTLIGSMVPPTDPWYEDRTGDFPLRPRQGEGAALQTSGRRDPRAPARPDPARMPCPAARWSRASSSRSGFTVSLDQLEFPAAWLQTVFTDHDYDMSIVAHVEPRDMPAVFGNPKYYTQYDNTQLQSDLAAADAGTAEEQVTDMKKAASELSEDAAADFLFLLPNLIVADKGITGLPKNAITECLRPARPSGLVIRS